MGRDDGEQGRILVRAVGKLLQPEGELSLQICCRCSGLSYIKQPYIALSLCRICPYPNPLPASGERIGPAEREGEGPAEREGEGPAEREGEGPAEREGEGQGSREAAHPTVAKGAKLGQTGRQQRPRRDQA